MNCTRARAPNQPAFLARGPLSFESICAPSQQPTDTARLDGKDFFRQARLRLTYEQFNQFLTNIKRLNDHAQSREETIQKAQEIFGSENDDLFVSFKALLSKHGLS